MRTLSAAAMRLPSHATAASFAPHPALCATFSRCAGRRHEAPQQPRMNRGVGTEAIDRRTHRVPSPRAAGRRRKPRLTMPSSFYPRSGEKVAEGRMRGAFGRTPDNHRQRTRCHSEHQQSLWKNLPTPTVEATRVATNLRPLRSKPHRWMRAKRVSGAKRSIHHPRSQNSTMFRAEILSGLCLLQTHSAHSSSACARTIFTASSCRSGGYPCLFRMRFTITLIFARALSRRVQSMVTLFFT